MVFRTGIHVEYRTDCEERLALRAKRPRRHNSAEHLVQKMPAGRKPVVGTSGYNSLCNKYAVSERAEYAFLSWAVIQRIRKNETA